VVGKLPVPSMGWFAHFLDQEGNTIGLLQPDASAATDQA
jgi:predicted enzyme related to lactoylglutathione lyase